MNDNLHKLRHSLAHILAQAVLEEFPDAKLGFGPPVENGFYYDFKLPRTLHPEDLEKLEVKMREIIKADQKFELSSKPVAEAVKFLDDQGQVYKVEAARDLEKSGEKELTFYKNGSFIDMCAGPHVSSTKKIPAKGFKLWRIAGAYWKGDEKQPMLQRIYGLAFANKKELDEHLAMLAKQAKCDHRKINKEMELFMFAEEVGPGLPLWLPYGTQIKELLEAWGKETENALGYKRVSTPVITKENLFYTSEHLPHYKDSMYSPMDIDGENYYIKPMNCPFHHLIFKHRTRSYRELPLRLAEYGWCHRYEDSGALFGLMRVRGMKMNDAHIYCAKEDAVDEFIRVLKLHEFYYKALKVKDYHMELALRNPEEDKYHGDDAMWQEAEDLMREAMEKSGIDFVVAKKGAAFYGPKIDFQVVSSIGREFSASTNQIDLFMPKKFNLKYIDKEGKEQIPVCIHRSPLGTHERFIGFLIEHFGGNFPLWLAPVQALVLNVSDVQLDYTRKIYEQMLADGLRVELDVRNESVGKKIREAELKKIPYVLVIGGREVESGKLSVREKGNKETKEYTANNFIKMIKEQARPQISPNDFK